MCIVSMIQKAAFEVTIICFKQSIAIDIVVAILRTNKVNALVRTYMSEIYTPNTLIHMTKIPTNGGTNKHFSYILVVNSH